MSKKHETSVEEFANSIVADYDSVITWAENEIKEYQNLIAILKERIKNDKQ